MNRHTSGCIRRVWSEEDASVGRHGRFLAQDVLENAQTSSTGVGGLGHLGKLQRIPQQDEVVRRPGSGQGIGQGQLARFVDDQHIDRRLLHDLVRKQPGGAGHQVELVVGTALTGIGVLHPRQTAVIGLVVLADAVQLVPIALLVEDFDGSRSEGCRWRCGSWP